MDKGTCETCRFWERGKRDDAGYWKCGSRDLSTSASQKDPGLGECRIRADLFYVREADDWCGEHQPLSTNDGGER